MTSRRHDHPFLQPRCLRCGKPYNNDPDYGRFIGWCWPCVRRAKGLKGGRRK